MDFGSGRLLWLQWSLANVRRWASIALAVLLGASLSTASLSAQATAPAVAFANTNVGSNASANVTFTFSASTTVASVSVVTQGATGLDFQSGTQALATACAAGTYAANATCTVAVKFAPTVPGVRLGAAVLLDSNQNKLASGVVSGIGMGGLAQLPLAAAPGITTSFTAFPVALAYDGAGNLYTGAEPSGNNPPVLTRISPNGTVTSLNPTYPSGSNFISSIAVDPAGVIFMAVGYAGQSTSVLRYDPVTGASSAFASGVSQPQGVTFDRSGTLYVADDAGIDRVSSAGTVTNFYNQPNSNIYGLAFDPAGNLYFATFDYPRGSADQIRSIYKIAAGQNTSTFVVQTPQRIYGLAIDAASNIFYHSVNNSGVFEIPAGSTTPALVLSGSSIYDQAIALSGTGMLSYATNNTSITAFNRLGQTVTLPAGTTTPVNGQSAPQSVTVENDGNAPVNFTSFTPAGPAAVASSGYTCAVGTPLPVGGTCTVGVSFAPTAHGSPQTGTVTLAGNTLSSVVSITGYVAGDAVSLSFTPVPPTTLSAGGNAGMVKVTVQDNSGATVTNSTAAITLAVTSTNGYSQSYMATAVSGIATFNLSGVPLTKSGTYSYVASSSGLTGASASESVTPGPASTLFLTAMNPSPYVGVSDTISVTAQDAYGNTAASDNDQTALTSTDSTATLPSNFSLSSGTATTTIKFGKSGTFNVTATDTTTPAVNGTVSVTVLALPVFTVTTATDDATGIASNCPDQANGGAASSTCSLRDAIAATNAVNLNGTTNPQPIVNFASAFNGTTLSLAAVINATANVNIAGPGATQLTIAAGNPNNYSFLASTTAGVALTLSGVTVNAFGGQSSGAAVNISENGALILLNDTFTNNGGNPGNIGTFSTYGGAVYAGKLVLTVSGCTFLGGVAGNNGSTGGGAIYAVNDGSVTISGSTFGSQASPNISHVSGGALYLSNSAATVSTSTFAYNTAGTYGGAIYMMGNLAQGLTLTSDVFLNNSQTTAVSGDGGGAVYAASPMTIATSTFNNNSSKANGGAIVATNLLTVSGSSFSANSVNSATSASVAQGGAILDAYTTANGSVTNTNFLGNKAVNSAGAANGGALDVARMNLNNVVFSGNSTSGTNVSYGGAVFYSGNYTSILTGVTFTGNATQTGTTGATTQYGGAVYQATSILNLYNTTITGNSSKTGGGIYKASGTLNLYNSLISGNTASANYPDVSSAASTSTSSYVGAGTGSSCSGNCTPLLSALGSFGGGTVGAPGYTTPVQVLIPLPSSPLLASGSTAYVSPTLASGATTDPRGFPRTVNGNVDIGAAEANYSLLYVQQPGNVETGGKQTSAVQLYESGSAFGAMGGTLVLADSAGYASPTSVATTASGLETLNETYSTATTADTLTASVASTTYPGGTATVPITVASVASNAFNVVSAAGATEGSLQVSGFPASTSSNSPQTVKVTAFDTNGAVFTGYIGTVTLTSSDPNATLPAPYTFTAADAGVHTFAVTLKTGGTQSITASDGTFTASQTGIFVVQEYVFVVNSGGTVTTTSANGTVQSSAVAGGGIGAAVDAAGYVWSINAGGNGVSKFTDAGALSTSYSGSSAATAIAIGGRGNVFFTNGNGTINALTNAGAMLYNNPVAAAAGISSPTALSVDSAGSLWIASAGDNSAVEIIGVAAPVVAPTVNAVKNANPGTRP